MKKKKNTVVPSILIHVKGIHIELTVDCLSAEDVCRHRKFEERVAESKNQIKAIWISRYERWSSFSNSIRNRVLKLKSTCLLIYTWAHFLAVTGKYNLQLPNNKIRLSLLIEFSKHGHFILKVLLHICSYGAGITGICWRRLL